MGMNVNNTSAQVDALRKQLHKENQTETKSTEGKLLFNDIKGKKVSINDLKWNPDDSIYKSQECFQPIPDIELHNNPCATLNPNSIPLADEEIKKHKSNMNSATQNFNKQNGAPSPETNLKGQKIIANAVVDKKSHTTFTYDDNGKFIKSFKNAIGAPNTPTPAGLRYITRIEANPFKSKYTTPTTKKNPKDYGPYDAYTRSVNQQTANTDISGIGMHGTKNENSIGKSVSHSCLRHHNKDITEMTQKKYIKEGDFVLVVDDVAKR